MSKFRSILPSKEGDKNLNMGSRDRRGTGNIQRPAARNEAGRIGNPNKGQVKAGSQTGRAKNRPYNRRTRRYRVNWPTFFVFGFMALLVIILIPTAMSLAKANRQLEESKSLRQELTKEKDKLQTSVNDLKSQLDIVNTDEFIQKYAHEKLGMVKPNEIIVKTEDGDLQINRQALEALEAKQKGLAPGATKEESDSSEESVNPDLEIEKGAEEGNGENPAAGIPTKSDQGDGE